MIPRTLERFFETKSPHKIRSLGNKKLYFTFIEIYNEEIADLFAPEKESGKVN